MGLSEELREELTFTIYSSYHQVIIKSLIRISTYEIRVATGGSLSHFFPRE